MRKPDISNFAAIFFLFLAISTKVVAADYPIKPIQAIVPFPPGGAADLTARIVSTKLASMLGQPVIVLNRPGGGGAIGMKTVATANPDGYTILVTPPSIVLLPILNPEIGFSLRDFVPIVEVASEIRVVAVKGDTPWKTLGDLIKEAKISPGKLTFSSAGFGTGYHFVGELFKIVTDSDILHVPMAGEAQAVTSLLGGHVDMTFAGAGVVTPHLTAGTLRVFALMYPNRIKAFPGIPTTRELGYPSLSDVSTWYGIFAPSKTPKQIVEKLANAFETALKDKEVIASIEKAGMQVEGVVMEKATEFFQNEERKWSEVAKKAKMIKGAEK